MGVNGSESRSQRAVSAPGGSSAAARAPSRRRARRRRSAICSSRNSSNASRRRPPSWSPKCAASSAAAAVREPLQHPNPRGQRLGHVAHRRPVLVHERRDLHRREPLGGRVGRHVLPHRGDLAGLGVLVDAEAAVALVLAGQQQPRARPVAALEPRLVEERHRHRPGLVGDAGGDERLHAAPAHRAARDRQHLRRRPSRPRPSPARRSAARRGGRAGCGRAARRRSRSRASPPPSRLSRPGTSRAGRAATASGSAGRSSPRPAAESRLANSVGATPADSDRPIGPTVRALRASTWRPSLGLRSVREPKGR